jgi:excisionase family DNA binding protein
MAQHQASPGLLDYNAAAPMLRCSPRMVRKLVETRQLESVKVGRLVRIEPAAIWRYIERHRRPVAGTGDDAA